MVGWSHDLSALSGCCRRQARLELSPQKVYPFLHIGARRRSMSIGALSLNTQSAAQSGAQARLQQAKREAERAERVAQTLQASAQNAENEARRADQEASSLSAQSNQATAEARGARQNVNALTNEQQRSKTQQVSQVKFTPLPVLNTQGQLTGTVVNTTA